MIYVNYETFLTVYRLVQSFEPSVCGTYLGNRRTSPHRVCTLTAHLLLSLTFIPSPTQLAIIEYLDETRGPPYLVPHGDPAKRAKVKWPL